VPGILVGATYGRLVGVFVSSIHPDIDESTYALLGSASYMAGSMRLVVSVSVMLLELTNQLSLLPLMMLVLVVAKAVGEGSGVPGIYQILTRMKAFPVLEGRSAKALRHLTAADLVQHQGEPLCFSRVEQVASIVAKLRACEHNGFPVLDSPAMTHGGELEAALLTGASRHGPRKLGNGELSGMERGPSQLLGVVLRHHLLVLLRSSRSFQHTPVVTHNSQRIAFMYDVTDFDKPVSSTPPTVDDIACSLNAQAMSMYVDLGPYVNPPSYIVQASTCASQTYNLFTSLGLRHLCVVPDTTAVLGVVTRKDLVPEHAAEVMHSKVWTSTDGDDAEGVLLQRGEGRGAGVRTGAEVLGSTVSSGNAVLEMQARPGRVGVVHTKVKRTPHGQ
jgi:chloride channel 7